MSLLVCLLGTDGLVLATDSRGTFGDPRGATAQNDLIKKLYLANERVGILVAGAGDLGSTLVSGFLALPDTASLGVTDLTMALHRYARDQFRQWFESFAIKPMGTDSRPVRPDLNFIVAGFELNQESKIYHMSSSLDFAPMLHNYGFGIEGVAQYALYLLNRLYDPKSVIEELEYLAAYVIVETASQDGKVGGPVQMATITSRDSQLLDLGVVAEISLRNRERTQTLKESFLKKEGRMRIAQSEVGPARGLKNLRQVVNSTPPAAMPEEPSITSSESFSTVMEEMAVKSPTDLKW